MFPKCTVTVASCYRTVPVRTTSSLIIYCRSPFAAKNPTSTNTATRSCVVNHSVTLLPWTQVVVDSGVIPKLVPLLKHKEGRIVVSTSTAKTPVLMWKDTMPIIPFFVAASIKNFR